ncbi:MAG: hypothetical protein K2O08_04125 [Clostridia bacterium]|nr:hypothetical protein [Clostridia bacterium]
MLSIKKFTYLESSIPGVTGIGFANDVNFGYNGKTISTIEAPTRFDAGNYDVSFVGAFSFVNYDCLLRGRIGRFCSIAPNCMIGAGEHDINCISTSIAFELNTSERFSKFSSLLDNSEYVAKMRECRKESRIRGGGTDASSALQLLEMMCG